MGVGAGIDRTDGPAKVAGAARYAAEFPVPDLVHAVLVQSTEPRGTLAGVDVSAAEALPGVITVITPKDAESLHLDKATPQTVTAPLLQNDQVHFNGQHIAVVVAGTLMEAEEAARLVVGRYQAANAATDMQAAMPDAYEPKHFRDGKRPPNYHRGDVEAAFDQAAVKLEASYATPIEHHNPMEPHATIARWTGDHLEVWTATQGISGVQKTLSTLFGIPAENVHVMDPFVGGGFGCKGNAWPPITLAAMAARKVGRPVKLVLSRQQMFTSNGYRPQTMQKIRLAAAADGKLAAISHDTVNSMSDPSQGEFSEPCGLATQMIYACDNVSTSHKLVPLNLPLPTYMRAPGEATGMFALESAMDELAYALKMDPVALRLTNYAETDEQEGKPFSAKKLRECYAQGAAAFGWNKRAPQPRQMRDGHALVGMGMATATYPMNRSAAKARVRINANGTAVVQSGTQDIGTGTYTVMTQVAAQALGLPVNQVRFELGNSDFPPAPVSGGSQTVASVAPAVQAACAAAISKLLALAAADPRFQGVPAQAIQWQNGMLVAGDRRSAPGPILARHGADFIEADGGADEGSGKKTHSLHSFGAHFCEVRVDEDLGEIRISRFVGAFDAGQVLNAKTARSQLLGGITFGIGMALLEETLLDQASGRFANMNIAEYRMPVNADIPEIETIFVDNFDAEANPLGARGVGELPMVGAAAAVANAVYHATGVRVRRLPIRIEDLIGA